MTSRSRGPLAGQVAVIAGAGGALGSAAATVLAHAGADVVLAGRRRSALDATAARVGRGPHRRPALCVPTDVTDPDSVAALVDTALEEHEGIDLLVNLAGRMEPAGIPVWEVDPAEWQRTLVSNVTGVFLTCRAVLPSMLDRGTGRILNAASPAGSLAYGHLGAYCASKAAAAHLTRVLAAELEGTGVGVCDFIVGATDTPAFHETCEIIGQPWSARLERDPEDALAMLVVLAQTPVERLAGATVRRDDPWVRAALSGFGARAVASR